MKTKIVKINKPFKCSYNAAQITIMQDLKHTSIPIDADKIVCEGPNMRFVYRNGTSFYDGIRGLDYYHIWEDAKDYNIEFLNSILLGNRQCLFE
jgi:hypothetical protein